MAAAQATSGTSISVSDQRKLMEILLETERVADRILSNRQELVQLDQRRQDIREALRLIEQHFPTESPRSVRLWITIGSMLVKQDRQEAIELLRKDQRTTETEIERLRAEQKVLVSRQRDLEHDRPLRGFDLKPLTRAEISGIRSNLPGF
ncbi:p53 and DNA damage-regulated protein 1 [Anopheles bellator]|uniref:p53 and DNA damage-regulated protein 1 n=1 Tax=Anopheles bellator TaxID=139047 RepID=UPI002647B22B|nr:p53 and DNA damage-regulated protein 1 [Anopheles bellator]XP_058061289.1 p53 and DNA damage-regulated protein 1 [Anopheles bellator]